MSPALLKIIGEHQVLFVLLVTSTLYTMRRALLPLSVAVAFALMLLGVVHLMPGGW